MQKAHDLWEGFNTFSRLLRGYYHAARGKADRESVLNFHRNLEANLFALREELEDGTYQLGTVSLVLGRGPQAQNDRGRAISGSRGPPTIHEILLPLVESSFYA